MRPVVRRFDIEVGHCEAVSAAREQGRHALQASDALGAAGAQLGPGVVALVVELHTEMGVPLAKDRRRCCGPRSACRRNAGRPLSPAAPHGPRRRADLHGVCGAGPQLAGGHAG